MIRRLVFCLLLALGMSALPPASAQERFGPFPGGTSPQVPATFPAIQVTLSRPVYYIHIDPKTGVPQMPKDVAATAQALNWPGGVPVPTTFTWRVYLDWDFDAYPTHHRINNETFQQPSPLKVNLNGEVRGGMLTVIAKALLNGQEVCGQARATVLGENPPRKLVLKAFPRSRFGLIASKIGTAESGLRQFTPARGLDPGGTPMISRTNDVGMMQINAPSGAITSADQVWDWRANVQRGLEMLRGKQRTTFLAYRHAIGLQRVQEDCSFQVACLNCVRVICGLPCLDVPPVFPISAAPGSGKLPDEPDPDHLSLSQWERDAIRRYNGGREYAFVVTPDLVTLTILKAGWEIDLTRGGISERSGDPNYVTHVLNARSGLVLPPPHKPAPAKHRHTKRRHAHR